MSFIKSSGYTLLSLLLLCFQQATAADLVVIDGGPAGTYGSIGAAITAASNGDRIIVTNKPSAAPWIENLIVNKSLTFVSATDNVRFKLQGNITIQPANGREVTIIGLESIGGVVQGTTNTSSTRTVVNILGSSFNYSGAAIDFDFNNYDLTVANCDLGTTGNIDFNYGKILGNQVGRILKTPSTINTTDKIQIIGNQCALIEMSGSDGSLEVTNNFISGNSASYNSCIYATNLGANTHIIANNTIDMAFTLYGIWLVTVNTGSSFVISNNVIYQSASRNSDSGIRVNTNNGSIVSEYNYISTNAGLAATSNYTLSTTDQYVSTVTIAGDGRNLAGSPAIDGANPSIQYYDLDLTRGDAGAYGGSFTLDNYFPLTTGSSRVYHVIMDRGVFQGYNLDVKALGFDR